MKTKKYNKGFTLVETMVAVSILMIAIVGPMTIVQNGLKSSQYARQEFIAQFLAQEALEYVRNIRDNNTDVRNCENWSGGALGNCDNSTPPDWLNGLNDCVVGGSVTEGCALDVFNNSQKVKPFSQDPTLYFDDTNKIYGFFASGKIKTEFSRVVKIEKIAPLDASSIPQQAKVTVTVSWSGLNNSYSLTSYIFNYR
jgi:prepilin-type N-terminal cleavage/methylation domain-containing protein